MDAEDRKRLKDRLAKIQMTSAAEVLQTKRLGPDDNLDALTPTVEGVLDIIAMVPMSALDDLPTPVLRALSLSITPLLNFESRVLGYSARDSQRTPEMKREIEQLAAKLFDNTMSKLASVLVICQTQRSGMGRLRGSYRGRLGSWNVVASIGAGGQGAVSRAWNPAMHMAGALKVVNPNAWRKREILTQRLMLEKEDLSGLVHPNILRLLDCGEDPEPFLVTQIAAFGTLHDWVPALRGDVDRVVSFLSCAARGLEYVHEQGLVHRDIKPANIFILSPDFAAVGDFGIRWGSEPLPRLTDFSEGFAADRIFAPPEVHDADQYEPHSSFDVFSLGATMHCALKGEFPKRPYWRMALDGYESLTMALTDLRLEVMDELIKSMLSIKPTDRPTIGGVRDVLSRLPVFPRTERKRKDCAVCGNKRRKMSVEQAQALSLREHPGAVAETLEAWQCDTCRLLAFYT